MGYAITVTITILLGLATLGTVLFTMREMFDERDLGGAILGLIMIAVMVILTALPFAVYDYAMSPEFTLKKSEWHCTASHGNDEDGYVCDQYRRTP